MHEFSIAEAVLDLARNHVPDDAVLETVHVEAGPMRGIEPDALHRVFEAFYTTKSSDIGTGLGLYLARSIVAHHGGQIRIDSRIGQGTTVVVTLPAAAC